MTLHLFDARSGLEVIERAECYRLLAQDEIGRLAVVVGGSPHLVPVNYVVDGEDIVFRSDPGTKLDQGPWPRACFEIDAFDRAERTGWSIVAHGHLEVLTEFDHRDADRVMALPVQPWAGDKQHWVRLIVDRITGRRLGRA